MPNNCLSVLYKRIIQVENKYVGLKVGGHKHTIAPPIKKVGGHMPPLPPPPPPPPPPLPMPVYIYIYGLMDGLLCVTMYIRVRICMWSVCRSVDLYFIYLFNNRLTFFISGYTGNERNVFVPLDHKSHLFSFRPHNRESML